MRLEDTPTGAIGVWVDFFDPEDDTFVIDAERFRGGEPGFAWVFPLEGAVRAGEIGIRSEVMAVAVWAMAEVEVIGS
jgi:hypothetical protein